MLKFNPNIDCLLFRNKSYTRDIIEMEVNCLNSLLRELVSERKALRKQNADISEDIKAMEEELQNCKPEVLETTEDFLNVIEQEMFVEFEQNVQNNEQVEPVMFQVFFNICVERRDLRLPVNEDFWESLCEYLKEHADYFIDILPKTLTTREVYDLDMFLKRHSNLFSNWHRIQETCEMTYYLGLFTFEILKEIGLGVYVPSVEMEETDEERARDIARRLNWMKVKQRIFENKKASLRKIVGEFE